MSQTIERTALTQFVTNEKYARKVLPFMKRDYFSDKIERIIFEEIIKFVDKYNKIPTQTSLEIEVQGRKDLNEEEYNYYISSSTIADTNDDDISFNNINLGNLDFIDKFEKNYEILSISS
mgnify:CR=1 FL=1